MTTCLADGFRNVDGSVDRRRLARCLAFLDGLPDVCAYKDRALDDLDLAADARVADVACGLGFDLVRLTRRAPHGRILGTDISVDMAAAARRLGSAAKGVAVCVMDAHALAIEDGAFDAVRIDRSLQHVASPQTVISEMARVCRRGGRVAACEPDWSTFRVTTQTGPALDRIVEDWCKGFRNRRAGACLVGWMESCRLEVCRHRVQALRAKTWEEANLVFDLGETIRRSRDADRISREQAAALFSDLADRDRSGRLVARVDVHTVTATRT